MTDPKRTALHEEHTALGASFTDFGGWDMPLKYGSELAEHRAVREAAGLFDLSHMGEVWVSGPDAAAFLNTALVGNLAAVAVGRAKYSLICDAGGGIVDDLIVYRITDTRYLVVPNAGNAETVAGLLAERAEGFHAEVSNASAETSLVAVQGPAAERILLDLLDERQHEAVTGLRYYAWAAASIGGSGSATASGPDTGSMPDRGSGADTGSGIAAGAPIDVLLARTGYTGEDGFELFVPNDRAAELWRLLLAAGAPHGLIPAGLASRDSLRLEAGMPLYGNELSREVTPFEAGLGPVVSFAKEERFAGRDALEARREAGPGMRLVGLRGSGRRAGRAGYSVLSGGEVVGRITSGQPSPTLGYPVALAYVSPEHAEIGTRLEVDLRGRPEPFEVVPLPFYRRPATG
ncbi:glycine cleavage system aminomethyltransferase GcvT [Leucobacter triazinivorans]|uniref:Aminomethyltransferase n=1 Tax=Leucobacter triazinivorans TaxID=1784719 RepID=A0A4P6KCU3_9MICO|nr:glycine cleavage system aminomethyltransferase GcvT [Leucobacter triazinivorans]QBE48185.1 glycine cleavage system protein T [Leucobacter triazinivorans]